MWSSYKILLVTMCAILCCASAANRRCYGSISGLTPTGKRGSVQASINEVTYNLRNLQKYRNCFDEAADENCVEASLIAALASRESGGGATLRGGYGDNGKGWGIMQCDLRKSNLPCQTCGWDTCCHVNMMVKRKIVPDIKSIGRKFPSWTSAKVLQGATAAYNFGVSNVQSWERLDQGSTGNDYSNDVIARAQYLLSQGWN